MDTYTPHLTSLEYFGLETLFRHLITEYGSTYQGEGANLDFRRTHQGVSVCDPYYFGSFAARETHYDRRCLRTCGIVLHGAPTERIRVHVTP